MGFTAITNNIDWQDVDFLNEYVDADRERETAVAGVADLMDRVSAGDDIQAAAGVIGQLQTRSIGLLTKGTSPGFYDPDPTDYNDDAAFPSVMSAAQLKTAAGIPDGFRRATTIPTDWTDYDDAAFSYGAIQAGDIIGPWIFADLQAVYKQLTRSPDPLYSGVVDMENGSGSSYAGDTSGHGAWADAKDDADDEWDFHGDGGVIGRAEHWSWGKLDAGSYSAKNRQARATLSSSKAPIGVERTVSWYARPRAPWKAFGETGTFDDQGAKRQGGTDAYTEDDVNLVLQETYTGSGSGTRYSTGLIGSVAADTKPTWLAEPATYDSLGWEITEADMLAIVDWNFTYK